MGSYRRGADNSGDVDFLITRNDEDGLNHSGVIERLVKRLMYMGVITHEVSVCLSGGAVTDEQLSAPHDWKALEAKWMGVGRLKTHSIHRRIGTSHHCLVNNADHKTSSVYHSNNGVRHCFTLQGTISYVFRPPTRLIPVQSLSPPVCQEERIQPQSAWSVQGCDQGKRWVEIDRGDYHRFKD